MIGKAAFIIISFLFHIVVIGTIYLSSIYSTKEDFPRIIEMSLVSPKDISTPAAVKRVSQPIHQEKCSKRQSSSEFEPDKTAKTNSTEVDTIRSSTDVHTAPTTDSLDKSDRNSNIGMIEKFVFPKFSNEEVQNLYEKENLQLIANSIRKHTVYPAFAEEAGISGIVRVQFVVLTDGSIGTITVNKSSGSKILDQDALETVKRSGPFPKPSLPVTLNFPLEYNLEQ